MSVYHEMYNLEFNCPLLQELKAECKSVQNNWNALQTDVNVTLEAGKIYYVEFVGVMWNYDQVFGVGLTKKNTPYQTYDVDISRKEYPYWYWKQTYNDEIQVRTASCSQVQKISIFLFISFLFFFIVTSSFGYPFFLNISTSNLRLLTWVDSLKLQPSGSSSK